ncbi:MAG: glycosyltransferase, partial [Planctomycetota bacterium]
MGEQVDRAIYLDCDVLVRESLHGLWQTPLPDGGIALAVQDTWYPFAEDSDSTVFSLFSIPPEAPLFNSGVMLVDLAAWRGASIEEQ